VVALISLMLLATSVAGGPKPTVHLEARAYQPGEVILVIVDGIEASRLKGKFLGEEISFLPGKLGSALAFCPIDLETKVGMVTLTVRADAAAEKPEFSWSKEVRILGKKFPTGRLKVDPKYVAPTKEELERDAQEKKRLKSVFETVSLEPFFQSNFSSPVPGAPASRFGERRFFNDEPRMPHSGADLKATEGTPVHAPARGKVVLTEDMFFPGKTVVLDHGYGLHSYYSHLSEMSVKAGAVVAKGDLLGKVGATGRVTGPHLHWGVKVYNERVDPFSLVDLDLERYLPESSK